MKALKKQTLTLAVLLTVAGGITLKAQDMPASVEINDPGADAVVEAQNSTPKVEIAKTAEQQVEDFMNARGYSSEWDEKKKRFFVVETDSFDCKSPSSDESFLVKRDIAVKKAILRAKAEIIEFVNTKMSASEQLYTPGTDINKAFYGEIKETEKQLAAQKAIVQKLLGRSNAAEAKALEGVTWGDRFKALMDGAIKKLDSKYNSKAIEAKNKAKFEKAKANYLAALNRMKAIEIKAAKMKAPPVEEFASEITTIAKMPLFGATIIMQAESWDKQTKRYEVAILLCWSNKLERAARAIMTGESDYRVAVKGNKQTINQWLSKQNLAVMSGPRQYLDANGNRWFIGISARALPKASSKRRKAKYLSKMFAKQMAAFSLYGDMKSHKKAVQAMQTKNIGDRDFSKAVESMSSSLTQEMRNIRIRGMQNLRSKTAIHPISGHEIYISVYGINPSAAASALGIEATNLAAKRKMTGHQADETRTFASTSKKGKGKSGVETGDADVDDSF